MNRRASTFVIRQNRINPLFVLVDGRWRHTEGLYYMRRTVEGTVYTGKPSGFLRTGRGNR